MKVIEYALLSDYTYYRIGGKSRYLLLIENQEDVVKALQFVHDHHISPLLPLGLGSNMLLPDDGFEGGVLLLRGSGQEIHPLSKDRIQAFAGETIEDLINASFSHNLVGLEWAGGLPSTVGGAIRGNAGAFGSEIKDTLFSVDAINITDPGMVLQTFTTEQADFSYRTSFFKKHPQFLVVSGTFQLKQATDEELTKAGKVRDANVAYRRENHPIEYPSCGSVFKNITQKDEVEKILAVWPDIRELSEKKWHRKVSMGYIINRLGFSGKQIGGAQVSTKHTNYIINRDKAKAADVKALINIIQETFYQTFGFIPEPEVMLFENSA